MKMDNFNFAESGILWFGDRQRYHALGYKFYLSGPRLDVSLGPDFEQVEPYHCCLGLLISPGGEIEIAAIPTSDNVPFGFHELLGDHWKPAITSDFLFTRLHTAAPPIRLRCWEGPADFLSNCEAC